MTAAHEVIQTTETSAVCRCGEVFESESYHRARIDHVRHALANRHDVLDTPDDDEEPF